MDYIIFESEPDCSWIIRAKGNRQKEFVGSLKETILHIVDRINKAGKTPKDFSILIVSENIAKEFEVMESDLWQETQIELWLFGRYKVDYEE